MSNIGSNRSPSPLSSRNCRNSESNSTMRRSFNENPFGSRPNALINPKNLNPPTPANTPTTTDHMKRNSITRKSVGSGSMFQDGKENHKDALRSPAKGGSKNFMAPTISAASKFTPSPRKKILGEKNDLTRTSIQLSGKDSDLKCESMDFDQTVEQKEVVTETPLVKKVTFSSTNDEKEMTSDVTEDNTDFVKIRPFCCSPVTSPIIAPLDADPYVPPYDPKKNFLSPRPQYLRYKPNPRIDLLLNKEDYGEDDVTRLEESFNLSGSSLESEEQVGKNEAKLDDSVNGSSEDISEVGSDETHPDFEVVKASEPLSSDDSSEIVSEEKQSDSMVKKASKPLFFTRTKTVSFIFVMFIVACFSLSFTESPPIDLPIYNDIGFPDVYHESLKFAAFARESFDDVVANVKQWSIDFVSYLSDQKSHLFPTQKTSPIQFFNLTTSSIQEEFLFNRHIGTDYIHDIHEYKEEMEDETETIEYVYEEMEVDDEVDVVDEVVSEEELTEVQIDNDGAVESNPNLEDEFVSNSEVAQTETQSDGDSFVELKTNYKDETVSNSEVQTEIKADVEEGYLANSGDDSQILSSLLTISVNTICLVICSMVIAAASAIFYMKKAKSQTAKTTKVCIGEDNMCRDSGSAESSSAQNGYKKRASNNKRESLASSSDFSMGSPSYGSFTTFERIPIKGDEVMLTPIRRSSRLLKK
uniref:uncharacterized protein LOC122597818 n=1 Tax=Erigeron canadensis TaxID=72917 RepID=UPI001CB8C50C|nr:uncharacterized protein LOC122597818 [Erigeron canadensis]